MNKHLLKYIEIISKVGDKTNTSTDIDLIKEEADKEFSNFLSVIKHNEFLTELKTNKKNINFGDLKLMFESISDKLFLSDKGRSIINKYTTLIKENKQLCNLYLLYENLTKPTDVSDVKGFVTESLNLVDFDKKLLREEKDKLFNVLIEGLSILKDVHGIELDEKTTNINETIDYLITHGKKLSNLSEYTNKINEVTDHVSNLLLEQTTNLNSEQLMEMIGEFTDKYGVNLSENEANTVKEMLQSNNKNLFENYKNSCLETINEVISNENTEDDVKTRLTEIKEKLEQKEYNTDTVENDIAKFIDLKNTIENK
jgi:hypothetical protein